MMRKLLSGLLLTAALALVPATTWAQAVAMKPVPPRSIGGTFTSDTASGKDYGAWLIWKSTANAVKTQTLPACSAAPNGLGIGVSDGAGTAGNAGNNINIVPPSGSTINGGTTGVSISSNRGTAQFVCDASATNWILVANAGGSASSVVMGGDVTGNSATSSVVKLQGVAVSATTPTVNQFLTYNGTNWAPFTLATVTSVTMGGDVTGNSASATVVKLQGVSVATTAPTANQVLTSVGGVWTPTTPAAVSSVTMGGDVNGNSATSSVVKIQGVPVSTTAPTNTQVLTYNGSQAAWANPTGGGTGTGPITLTTSCPATSQNGTTIALATGTPAQAAASNYQIVAADCRKVLTATAGPIKLPAVAGLPAGFAISVQDTNVTGGAAVSVQTTDSSTINAAGATGTTANVIAGAGGYFMLDATGSNWLGIGLPVGGGSGSVTVTTSCPSTSQSGSTINLVTGTVVSAAAANYQILAADCRKILTATAGPIKLPAVSGLPANYGVTVQNTNLTGGAAVAVQTTDSSTIAAGGLTPATSVNVPPGGQLYAVIDSTGSNWVGIGLPINPGTVSGPGYSVGAYYQFRGPATLATSSTGTNALTYCGPGWLDNVLPTGGGSGTITTIQYRLVAAGSGNIAFAIMSDQLQSGIHRPGTVIGSTASIVDTAAGQGSANLQSPISLAGPALYWTCVQVTDTTVTWTAMNNGAWWGGLVGGAGVNNMFANTGFTNTVRTGSSFGTWPNTSASWTELGGNFAPWIVFQFSSIP